MKKDPLDLGLLAHDLRNALSSIYGYAQLLELMLQKHGMEKELKSAQALVEAVKNMEGLITVRLSEKKAHD